MQLLVLFLIHIALSSTGRQARGSMTEAEFSWHQCHLKLDHNLSGVARARWSPCAGRGRSRSGGARLGHRRRRAAAMSRGSQEGDLDDDPGMER